MLRFTIRDLLWLMVVVGMTCGWLVSNRVEYARHRREKADLELWLFGAAQAWAEDKGEPVSVAAGEHFIEAMPNGLQRKISKQSRRNEIESATPASP